MLHLEVWKASNVLNMASNRLPFKEVGLQYFTVVLILSKRASYSKEDGSMLNKL